MPTYDYECQKCGHTFEHFQSITAQLLEVCPECKGKLKRLIGTGAGIIFKGSGFYSTDYRSSEYKKQAKSEKEASTNKTCPQKDSGAKNCNGCSKNNSS